MVQLKYILSFAALLAYVGAESREAPKPGEIYGLCGGTDKIQCGQDLECILENGSEGRCQWKTAKEGESCGALVNPSSCAEGLHCKYPKNGICGISDSIHKRSKPSVGRNRCNPGYGPSKEGTECDTDSECGRGLKCYEKSDIQGICVKK